MRASVIIPTHGRPVAVKAAIRSLLAIDPKSSGAEIVVVDNNSDDAMSADLRSVCVAAAEPVRYVPEPSPGLGAARHTGAREARGEVLIFIDDDVQVSPRWLTAILETFEEPDVGLVGGPSIPSFTGTVPAWFWDFLEPVYEGWGCGRLSLLDLGKTIPNVDPNMIWGLNFSIRRDILRRLGGFHPDLVPRALQRWQGDGETGLTMKAQAQGVRAVYCQDALLHHLIGADRLTQEYFAKRAYFQGVCDSYTKIRSGVEPDPKIEPPTSWGGVSSGPWSSRAQSIRSSGASAYRDGWLFHQREAAGDLLLVEWIRRKDYWDADIRTEVLRRPSR
jgi:glycosyltransferase involved in cell wall biosynthesis